MIKKVMTILLIINYIMWIYEALIYNRKVKNMNIDEVYKDMAIQLKPIILFISLIPYLMLISLILKPLIKNKFNV